MFGNLVQLYGSTEMGLYTQHMGDRFEPATLGQWYQSHPDLGPPLEWKMDDDGGLLVKGGTSFGGYYNDPEESEKALKFVALITWNLQLVSILFLARDIFNF